MEEMDSGLDHPVITDTGDATVLYAGIQKVAKSFVQPPLSQRLYTLFSVLEVQHALMQTNKANGVFEELCRLLPHRL